MASGVSKTEDFREEIRKWGFPEESLDSMIEFFMNPVFNVSTPEDIEVFMRAYHDMEEEVRQQYPKLPPYHLWTHKIFTPSLYLESESIRDDLEQFRASGAPPSAAPPSGAAPRAEPSGEAISVPDTDEDSDEPAPAPATRKRRRPSPAAAEPSPAAAEPTGVTRVTRGRGDRFVFRAHDPKYAAKRRYVVATGCHVKEHYDEKKTKIVGYSRLKPTYRQYVDNNFLNVWIGTNIRWWAEQQKAFVADSNLFEHILAAETDEQREFLIAKGVKDLQETIQYAGAHEAANYTRIYFPVFQRDGSHWVLFYVNKGLDAVQVLNSLEHMNGEGPSGFAQRVANSIGRFVTDVGFEQISLVRDETTGVQWQQVKHTPQQPYGYECGIMVCANLWCLVRERFDYATAKIPPYDTDKERSIRMWAIERFPILFAHTEVAVPILPTVSGGKRTRPTPSESEEIVIPSSGEDSEEDSDAGRGGSRRRSRAAPRRRGKPATNKDEEESVGVGEGARSSEVPLDVEDSDVISVSASGEEDSDDDIIERGLRLVLAEDARAREARGRRASPSAKVGAAPTHEDDGASTTHPRSTLGVPSIRELVESNKRHKEEEARAEEESKRRKAEQLQKRQETMRKHIGVLTQWLKEQKIRYDEDKLKRTTELERKWRMLSRIAINAGYAGLEEHLFIATGTLQRAYNTNVTTKLAKRKRERVLKLSTERRKASLGIPLDADVSSEELDRLENAELKREQRERNIAKGYRSFFKEGLLPVRITMTDDPEQRELDLVAHLAERVELPPELEPWVSDLADVSDETRSNRLVRLAVHAVRLRLCEDESNYKVVAQLLETVMNYPVMVDLSQVGSIANEAINLLRDPHTSVKTNVGIMVFQYEHFVSSFVDPQSMMELIALALHAEALGESQAKNAYNALKANEPTRYKAKAEPELPKLPISDACMVRDREILHNMEEPGADGAAGGGGRRGPTGGFVDPPEAYDPEAYDDDDGEVSLF